MSVKAARALVIGGTNLDIQCRSSAGFLAHDSNPGRTNWAAGGVGRNIAENLVRLGVETELLTVFGDGPGAEFLHESCGRLGIRCGRSLRFADRPSSQYVCILDADGSLVGAVADMEIFDEFTPEALERCGADAAMQEAGIVIVDANLPGESLAWIASKGGGKHLLLDPVSRTKALRARVCIGGYGIVKPNREEASVLSGVDTGTPEGVFEAARVLREKGVREVYISLGKHGLFFFDGTAGGIVRPPALSPVNLSGAGDAAAAALGWATLEGLPTKEKARYAVGAAALAAVSVNTVSERMNAAELEAVCKGVTIEQLS